MLKKNKKLKQRLQQCKKKKKRKLIIINPPYLSFFKKTLQLKNQVGKQQLTLLNKYKIKYNLSKSNYYCCLNQANSNKKILIIKAVVCILASNSKMMKALQEQRNQKNYLLRHHLKMLQYLIFNPLQVCSFNNLKKKFSKLLVVLRIDKFHQFFMILMVIILVIFHKASTKWILNSAFQIKLSCNLSIKNHYLMLKITIIIIKL